MAVGVKGWAGGGAQRAADEVRLCREYVAGGDLAHAASHLGWALFLAPALQDAYVALREIVAAAGSSEAARELFKGDGRTISPGNAAAILVLLAERGETSEALRMLGKLVAAHPEKPWTAAPWFSPELGDSVPLLAIGKCVTSIWEAVDNPAPPEIAPLLAPWLALARKAAARAEVGADVLCTLSALARRLGAYEDALAWCVKAEEWERSNSRATQLTLIMLGYALRDGGRSERAIGVWQRAAAMPPENAELLLDLVDITADQGDTEQSLRWAERAAAAGGSAAGGPALKPRAALLAARYRAGRESGRAAEKGGDIALLTQLVDLTLAHPEQPYVHKCLARACAGFVWLQVVHPPTEALCESFGHWTRIETSGQGQVGAGTAQMSSIEAPTPTAIHRARFPQVTISVPHQRKPDPRKPVRTDFGPPLWSYQGADATEATASVGPPSPAAVALLNRVAAGFWTDPLLAFEHAAPLGRLGSAELLGLLAHIPHPRAEKWVEAQREHPLYWQRLAQAWVCVGILHHRTGEPWAGSARRTLLMRLLFGPDDWTVDAAAFALCVAAWRQRGHRTEIAEAIAERYLRAAEAVGKRPTELHDPLAHIVLICPGVDPEVVRLARRNLAVRNDAADERPDPERIKRSLLRKVRPRKGR
ncbi:tetratricopeptide repeat protein [Streptomyces sp. CA-111067]|uniref:tetratricopeptide repeat protein n=1 Tax=Streptomyces sp. CA-111067 TaxID=3240046 RepID=UPI003D98986F